MEYSVENLCGFLIRSKLLPQDDIRALYQRWLNEAGPSAAQAAPFLRWLVTRQYLTDYQATLLGKGQVDNFFLNEYKVLERVGRGRMAGVYKAVHTLGQVVAIKVLPPSRARNPSILARFQREARLALRLRHPNIVRSFQVGQARDLYYLVMEYLEGDTLDEVLQRRKRLTPEEAVRLVHQALLGLQHLHEQGMVHRDLKPSNMMLIAGPQGPGGDTTLHSTIKILDIGLARELYDEDSPPDKEDQLTADGVILGTPDYMAPEQARDARTSDIRADIYSLGCVLYQLLAGQVPFPEKNLLRQLVRHANEKPRSLREFNPDIPEGLEQIVQWMMAKKPEERYGTPVRAAQAMEMFLLAGNEPARTDDGAQMRSYLTWLETEGGGSEPVPLAAPVTVETYTPAQIATPIAAPVVAAPPVAAPLALSVETYIPPATPPTVLPPARRPSEKPAAREAKSSTRLKPPEPAPAPIEPEPEEHDEALPIWERLSRRDWILLGLGTAFGLSTCVVGELFLFVMKQLFGTPMAVPELDEKPAPKKE